MRSLRAACLGMAVMVLVAWAVYAAERIYEAEMVWRDQPHTVTPP